MAASQREPHLVAPDARVADPAVVVGHHAADIEARVANWNENPTPHAWRPTTAEQILERLASYCAAFDEAAGS